MSLSSREPGMLNSMGSGSDGSNDWLKKAMMGSGAAGIGSGLMSLFGGGGNNPYDAAGDFYNQIPGTMSKYYDPYINAGKGELSDLQGQYSDLMKDPGSILAKIGGGYQKSPGYDFERNEGLNSINNAAAAGGMLGTASHQRDAGDYSTGFANRDFNQYLQQALGLWGKGLSGKEHINDMGFNASTGLADNLAQALMSQGNLAYEGAKSQNKSDASGISDIMGGIGAIAPFLIG